jgi:SNF2 family DNA or RNA helicase
MFNFFKNNFKTNKSEPEIEVKRTLLENGVEFEIDKIDNEQIEQLSFPITYGKYFDLRNLINKDFYLSLQILEGAWHSEELIEKDDGSYFLHIDTIYQYQNSVQNEESLGEGNRKLNELLGLKPDENLEITIDNNGVIGSSNFKLEYIIKDSQEGYISKFYDRVGPFFPLNNNQAYVLNKKLTEVLDLIDNPPEERGEQFKYFAKVKSKAKKLDIKFNPYLEGEEYYFPEDLDIDIELESIDHLKLNPRFDDLDDQLNQDVEKVINNNDNYTVNKTGGKNQRVFIGHESKESYKKASANSELTGSQVPDFIENPMKYLPDNIDLEKFSERVKGLKKRVYRAQPFVSSSKTDQIDWFNINVGVNIKNESDEAEEEQIELSEFERLVKEARENGEDYVLYNDNWVKVPKESEDFIEGAKKVDEIKKNGSVNKEKLKYIFDIYENIDLLEYNEQMIDFRSQLQEDGVIYQAPSLFKGELRPYQKRGYVWLHKLKDSKLGGLLADDMGLGKTIQVIALMASLKADNKLSPSLIVAPKSLLENWQHEIKKFSPEINKVYIHLGSSRNKNSRVIQQSDVVLTTYSTLVSDQVLLGEIDWIILVCDEVQAIRNQSTLKAHAVKAQKAKLRLGLSGTPVQNTVADLWSIYDFAQPGLLDSFKVFQNNFVKPIENSDTPEEYEKYEGMLKEKIQPVFLRRTKEGELKDELPEKIDITKTIEMSQRQKERYKEIIEKEKNSKGRTHLGTLQSLLQLSSHPALLDKNWNLKSAEELLNEGPKLKSVINILREVKKNNEKVLIFTTFKIMQLILQRVIREKFGLQEIPIINGDSKQRLASVDRFNESDGFGCMILSPRAAGTGLNITGANHVIHYTRWWNPAVEQQATDRVYRIGQEKEVNVYYPIMTADRETVEEKLHRLLEEKKRLAKNIIVPNNPIQGELLKEMNQEMG